MSTTLRAVTEQDCSFLSVWASHPEITRNTLGRRFPTQELFVLDWIRSSNTGQFPSRVAFIIQDLEPCGLVQLDQIDWVSKTAWLGIWLIPDARGVGHGAEATAEILRYAARDLGLRQLRLLVRSDNGEAVSLYARFGFQTEGELIDAEYRDGEFQSLLVMCVDLHKLQSE